MTAKKMKVNRHLRLVMMDFIEQHPQIATGKFEGVNGRQKLNGLWQQLTVILNSQGFGEKSIEGWRNAFADWKSKSKQKWRDLKCYRGGTGGGPEKKPLNDIEERLMKVIGWSSVEGDGATEEYLGEAIPPTKKVKLTEESISAHSIIPKNTYETILTIPDAQSLTYTNIQPSQFINTRPVIEFKTFDHLPQPNINIQSSTVAQTQSSEEKLENFYTKNTPLSVLNTRSTNINTQPSVSNNSNSQSLSKTISSNRKRSSKTTSNPDRLQEYHTETMEVLNKIEIHMSAMSTHLGDIAKSIRELCNKTE